MSSQIIQFLSGQGIDHKGRTINQIRALPDHKLEREHDVIQWLFPSDIPSKYFDLAPVLTDEDIEAIKGSSVIQAHIKFSLHRIIRFYSKDDYWITQKNHNFLRITRILRFLWIAGQTHNYVCFSRVLDDIYIDYAEIIGEETFFFWKNANNKEFLLNPQATIVEQPIANDKTNPYDSSGPDDDEDDQLFNYI